MEHRVEDSNDLETDGESDIFEVYSKDYIDGLHHDDIRAIVTILYNVLVNKLYFPLTEAARIISDVIGKSDRTVREWCTTFIANDGTFLDTLQGKYQRTGILSQNEELNKKASKFVHENAFLKGKPNMTLSSFTKWVNQCLLPNYSLEPGYLEMYQLKLADVGFTI